MGSNNLEVLDGALLTHTYDGGVGTIVMAWFGGTTINVYTSFQGSPLSESTCFSLSDDKGRPCDVEEVAEHMDDIASSEEIRAGV